MAILIVYWTGTGNTEIMAEQLKAGIESTGIKVDYKTVDQVSASEALAYEKIAFGCPSMGIEELEEDEFEPFFAEIESGLKHKKVVLFGSYGWGAGEWMDEWQNRTIANGADLFTTITVNSTPSSEEEKQCFEIGSTFAQY